MHIKEFKYYQPKTIKEACQIKEKLGDAWFLAGGTFLLPFMRRLKDSQDGAKNIISLRSIGGISEITLKRNTLTIGAMAALDDLAQDSFVQEKLPLLPEILSYFSSGQIRNMATVGGSLCCGLPWVDLPIALLVLEAQVELLNSKSNTLINISEFMGAPKLISKNKLLTNIKIKIPNSKIDYAFVRFSKDTDLDVALVSVCVALSKDEKNKQKIIFAVNFGNRFAQRLNNVEKYFKENKLTLKWDAQLENLIRGEIQNLETHEYRRHILVVCFKRAVERLSLV